MRSSRVVLFLLFSLFLVGSVSGQNFYTNEDIADYQSYGWSIPGQGQVSIDAPGEMVKGKIYKVKVDYSGINGREMNLMYNPTDDPNGKIAEKIVEPGSGSATFRFDTSQEKFSPGVYRFEVWMLPEDEGWNDPNGQYYLQEFRLKEPENPNIQREFVIDSDTDWQRGDLSDTVSEDSRLLLDSDSKPSLLWSNNPHNSKDGSSAVTVGDDFLYSGSSSGGIAAVEPDSGERVWETHFYPAGGGTGSVIDLIFRDGKVFTVGNEVTGTNQYGGPKTAVKTKSIDPLLQRVLWSHSKHPDYIGRDIEFADGKVISTSRGFTSPYQDYNDLSVIASVPDTGDIIWSKEKGDVAAVEGQGDKVFINKDEGLQALSSTDGSLLWSHKLTAIDDIVAEEGVVYSVGGNTYENTGKIVAFDTNSQEKLWQKSWYGPQPYSTAITGGVLLVGLDNGTVAGMDKKTGANVFTLDGGQDRVINIITDANKIYTTSFSGELKSFKFEINKNGSHTSRVFEKDSGEVWKRSSIISSIESGGEVDLTYTFSGDGTEETLKTSLNGGHETINLESKTKNKLQIKAEIKGGAEKAAIDRIAVSTAPPSRLPVIKSCKYHQDGSNLDRETEGDIRGPRVTASFEDSVDSPYSNFDLSWTVNGREIAEANDISLGTLIPAIRPDLEQLEPGTYNLNALARAGERTVDNTSCGTFTIEEGQNQQPSASVDIPMESYSAGSEIPVDYSVNQEGRYTLEVFLGGEKVSSKNFDSLEGGYTEILMNETGDLRVTALAPGAWWNPLDQDQVIDSDYAHVDPARCTYDLYGEVENALESDVPMDEKKVHVGSRFTTLTAEGTFGWTVTAECGSEIEVEYRESGQELASTSVNLPDSGASVDGIEMTVETDGRDIQPEISVSPEEIDVFEGVDLTAYPEGDYTYRWDLNADNQYERRGRTVSYEWSNPGTKTIKLKIETGSAEFERERSVRVNERNVEVVKTCGFSREDYDAAGIEAEGPRLTATLEDSVDAPYNEFDLFWRVQGQDLGERGGVEPGTALPAIEPHLDQLHPGRYNLNVLARADGNYLDNQSCGSLTVREEPDLSPEIGVTPADPEVLEEVTLGAEPAGDYSYSWDLNSDGQYERTGREVTTEYESPGSKNVRLMISTENEDFETERTFEVENPEVSSSLEISKEEITPLEPVQISYEVGEAIAENGYSLQIRSPSGEKVLEVSESSTSGGREFVPSRDAEKGTYRAKLIASEGFLSSILRVVFGPEAEKEFEVIDASGELDRWRNYCQENGFDPLTASGRISCVKQLVGPECFKENPGQECIEIAESTCEYYVGTGFNPEAGRCGE